VALKEGIMSQRAQAGSSEAETGAVDSTWRGLYSVGGAASLAIALVYLFAMAVYMPAMRESPTPVTVEEWFALLQNHRLTGLFYLGFADVLIAILFGPVSLGLRAALERVSKTWTTIATPLAFVGIAVYLASNVSFSMLSLSSEYASATTEAQRAAILAAGHATISLTRGTANAAGMGLVWLASLIFSILMFRSRELGKAAAWIGVLAFSLLVPSFLFAGYTYGASSGIGSAMALVTSLGGGLLSLVWYIIVGSRLWRIGRQGEAALTRRGE
jgi:hypothetical protein